MNFQNIIYRILLLDEKILQMYFSYGKGTDKIKTQNQGNGFR